MKVVEKVAAPLAVITLLGALVLSLVMLATSDLEQRDRARDWRDAPNNPINVCIAQGGVPITSAWDGRLKTCQFK